MSALDWFWHYGQVMTEEDRQELSGCLQRFIADGDKAKLVKEVTVLMDRNEVRIVVKSKHKEIPYEPWIVGT